MGIIIKEENFNCSSYFHNITNFLNDNENNYVSCDSFIGNSYNLILPISFFVIALIGLILNLLIIKDSLMKKKTSSRKQSSMKKLFAIIHVLDCITSIYWIISSTLFCKAKNISEYKSSCAVLAMIYFSIFIFEFFFINFILIHFRKISLNPIEGILKPGKNIKKYIIICIVSTLLILANVSFFQILGRSPMNTCFINTEQSQSKGFIFLIPIFLTFCIIFQIIYDLNCKQLFINDKEVREAYKLNSMYLLIFSLLHFPMFLLILITSAKKDGILQENNFLIIYANISTLITCSIPAIIGLIRKCKGFTKIKKIQDMKRRFTINLNRKRTLSNMSRSFSKPLNETLTPEDQFDWLEKHAMEFFMRDILISISHCIYTGKSYGKNIYLNDLEKENETFIKHNIAFDNFRLDDPTVYRSDYLDVTVIEYAPKIFAYLRNLEQINIDEMAESFLPKNNKQGISESQGKSGIFFISTDDNQYMVKTLRVDEFDLIRKTFLNEYVSYITKNPNSLLCRIYGMYTITVCKEREILVIVMRNVIGEFKNNIIAQYDLKGSSANRISDFDMEKSDKSTMKDLNFNEFEHGIMISRYNIKRFRKLTKYDSFFLSRMALMDYSLFLVKITLSKEQAIDLFGDQIREKQDSAFSELMVESSLKPASSLLNNPQSLVNLDKISVDELKPKKSIVQKGQIFHNVKYYKQYLFPSLIPGSAYILAIIDYFQYFNFYKYVESGLKTTFGMKKDKVSCVDPKTYSKRFIKYFEKLTEIKHMLKDAQITDPSNLEEEEEDNEPNESENTGSDIELEKMK